MSEGYDPSGYNMMELPRPTPVRKRGRKSAEALSTSVVSIVPGERPPLRRILRTKAAIWQSTLARMPADWLPLRSGHFLSSCADMRAFRRCWAGR
jgi:hypothetical protein